jgi:hypothetical protein
MRGVLTVALRALREIAAWPAMTASPPMQRETIALSLEAVLTVALVRRRRCDLCHGRGASDKGRQAFDVAVVVFNGNVLRVATAKTRLLAQLVARVEELRVARQIGLRITGTEGGLLAHPRPRQTSRLVVHVVDHVVTCVIPAVHSALAAVEGSSLSVLVLRCGDQAEIMLGVLEIALLRNRISRRLRIARKLQVFLGNVGRSAPHFDIRSVRLVHPCERIVTLAVAPAHTLVLLISHD